MDDCMVPTKERTGKEREGERKDDNSQKAIQTQKLSLLILIQYFPLHQFNSLAHSDNQPHSLSHTQKYTLPINVPSLNRCDNVQLMSNERVLCVGHIALQHITPLQFVEEQIGRRGHEEL